MDSVAKIHLGQQKNEQKQISYSQKRDLKYAYSQNPTTSRKLEKHCNFNILEGKSKGKHANS